MGRNAAPSRPSTASVSQSPPSMTVASLGGAVVEVIREGGGEECRESALMSSLMSANDLLL